MGETEAFEKVRRVRCQPPTRRAEAARSDSELVHLVDAPFEQTGLIRGAQAGPIFVAPAVVADLVSGVGDLNQRLGVEFGVEPLHKESGSKPEFAEHVEDPG